MKRTGPFVGFDVDGVFADCSRMVEAMCKATGQHIKLEDWTTYNFGDRYGMSASDFLELLVEERVLETARPVPGIRQAMERLHEHGLQVVAVTARSFHPRGDEVTRQWFAEQGIAVDRLALVHHHETKIDALRQVPDLLCYVDDYLGHLHGLAKAGVGGELFLMDQPWNRHDATFPRLFDLAGYVARAVAIHQRQAATVDAGALRKVAP